MTVYAQTELVKDLIAQRIAVGGTLAFEATDTEVDRLETNHPVLRYTDADGIRREVVCDVIAGCDGFHGICRPRDTARADHRQGARLPLRLARHPRRRAAVDRRANLRHHRNGFALHSLRSPTISRLYLQVDPDESIENWSDDRIWDELQRRFELPGTGWDLKQGPVLDKGITPMRSFVSAPMRYGRLFLAGTLLTSCRRPARRD